MGVVRRIIEEIANSYLDDIRLDIFKTILADAPYEFLVIAVFLVGAPTLMVISGYAWWAWMRLMALMNGRPPRVDLFLRLVFGLLGVDGLVDFWLAVVRELQGRPSM